MFQAIEPARPWPIGTYQLKKNRWMNTDTAGWTEIHLGEVAVRPMWALKKQALVTKRRHPSVPGCLQGSDPHF